MSRPIDIQETLTFNPTGYMGASNMGTSSSSYPPSNGYADHTSTTYAQLTPSSTSAVGYVYYTFSISGIPSGATITSVSCQAKVRINNTSRVTNTGAQLYANTTAKGSSQTFSTTSTSNVVTINGGTSWTSTELSNIRLRLAGQKGSSNNTGYIYFYGATLSISYSLSGMEYDITATLATDNMESIDPEGLTTVMGGNGYELRIDGSSLDNIKVEDNTVDVTNQLVRHDNQTISTTVTLIPSAYDSANSNPADVSASYPPSNALTNADSTTRFTFLTNSTANSSTTVYFDFDCSSIPRNATVTSVTCEFKAAISSNYFSTREAQLCYGTTPRGTAVTVTNTSATSGTPVKQTITDGGTWTRAELDNIKIRLHAVRNTQTSTFNNSMFGATLIIAYTVTAVHPYYWTYSLSNVAADHNIVVKDVAMPIPDEDPEYNYYPVTISSINASTVPGRGTTRLVEGSNQTIEIYPSDPSITLILDNGVDVSNLLVQHGGTIPDPTVTTASGATYGFTLNTTTGYYTSANKGVSKSAAVCRVDFDLPVECLVTFEYINYAEATYDFGVFGEIDTALSTSYYSAGSGGATITDATYRLACNTSAYNSATAKTLSYTIPAGQHYIYIKYSKDDATDANNDTLQFKISNIEPLEANNYYTYTLSNINQDHSLVFIFGDVVYYFVNSSGTGARLFPSGSMVQLPGDSYSLTVIPDDYSYGVSVTDNNIDVTSNVQRVEAQVTKDGSTYTVVNYEYKLTNINATHNIVVICSGSGGTPLYIKVNNSWVNVQHVFKKISNAWTSVEVSSLTDTSIYVYKGDTDMQ